MIIFLYIGSRPAMGKTTSAEKILTNILDVTINPNQNISVLKMNLEMGTQSLLLRDYKKAYNETEGVLLLVWLSNKVT